MARGARLRGPARHEKYLVAFLARLAVVEQPNAPSDGGEGGIAAPPELLQPIDRGQAILRLPVVELYPVVGRIDVGDAALVVLPVLDWRRAYQIPLPVDLIDQPHNRLPPLCRGER